MSRDDERYYRHRAEVEAERASKAQNPGASAAHHQLAVLYSNRASGGDRFQSMIND